MVKHSPVCSLQFMALERLFSSKNADVTERNSIKKLKDLALVDTALNPDVNIHNFYFVTKSPVSMVTIFLSSRHQRVH